MSFERKNLHIHRTKPIIFGGDPNDRANVQLVSRMQHAELSTFWNRKIKEHTSTASLGTENKPLNSKLNDSIDGPVSIASVEVRFNIEFPDDFQAYLESSKEGEGEFTNGYLVLWTLDELVKLNTAYNVEEFSPILILFGSDGAEDAFAFEKPGLHIVRVPFIGMGYIPVEKVADTFTGFLASYYGDNLENVY